MPEPSIHRIAITATPGLSIFVPNPQVITLNDSIFWANQRATAHQPAPDNGTADQWTGPIEPNSRSVQIVFDTMPTGGSISYHCALHPANPAEKGVITVNK